ncbi:MAG: hypothetical protein IPM29_25335 [Planctomycetes bacterium]|nr:hypothetical protein [Planctomycetota bacterium]
MKHPKSVHAARHVALRILAAAMAAVGSGCVTESPVGSRWPGDGFAIDARVVAFPDGEAVPLQSFLAWEDGLAVYREAPRVLPGSAPPIPVYSTVCVYELRPESIRMLARLLARAELFGTTSSFRADGETTDVEVEVRWSLRSEQGQITTRSTETGRIERVAHVINAFLPAGRTLRWPGGDLPGQPEPRRIEGVPEPVDDLAGSLACHLELVRPDRGRTNLGLLLDLFGIAVAAGDADDARDALRAITAAVTTAAGDAAGDPQALDAWLARLAALVPGPPADV